MIDSVNRFYSWNANRLTESCLPLEHHETYATISKIVRYTGQFFAACFHGLVHCLLLPIKLFTASKLEPIIPWDKITIDKSLFNGFTTSAFQTDGGKNHPHSTWRQWEKTSHIEGNQRSGRALDYWNHPEKLIENLKQFNCSHYRFSVEWSSIEPEKGKINGEALEFYRKLCTLLEKEGIKPVVTLHHFSDPVWFLNKKGFEDEKNIADFVDFSVRVHEALSPWVSDWVTINEPTIYAFQGYFRGVYPPGVRDTERTGIVLKNLAIAHTAVIDALPKRDKDQFGIAHQALEFEPCYSWEPAENLACKVLSQITNRVFLDFLKTGEFNFKIPFAANITYSKPDIHKYLDFVGLQYYTVPLISLRGSTCRTGEKMTRMPFRFYPQGLARVLEDFKAINKPIWITETGASTDNEPDQQEFLEKAFKVATFAKENGVPVKGILVWTIEDNFEWDMGYNQGFGVMARDQKMKMAGKWLQETFVKSNT